MKKKQETPNFLTPNFFKHINYEKKNKIQNTHWKVLNHLLLQNM